jgi:hypothetical protein
MTTHPFFHHFSADVEQVTVVNARGAGRFAGTAIEAAIQV